MPPSPKLQTTAGSGSGDGMAGGPLLERLQEMLGVPGLLDPYALQQEHQGRHRLRTQSGSGRVGYGGRAQRAQVQGQAAAAAVAPSGPRPYFWRLQQRLQAGAYRPGSGGTGGAWGALLGGEPAAAPVSEEDYVLLWRRQVYDNGLWAAPLGSEAPRISLGSGSARERRLAGAVSGMRAGLLGSGRCCCTCGSPPDQPASSH